MKHIFQFLILIFVFGVMVTCKKENQPPVIYMISADPLTIKTNDTTQLTCIATDPDGDQLTFLWSSADGTFPNGAGGNSVLWKAPDKPADYKISVSINDGHNVLDRDTIIVVKQKFNGTFIDSRDNHKYKWVRIGEQIWMAENLAFLPTINAINDFDLLDRSQVNYYVYYFDGRSVEDAKATYNYKTYGVLYTWYAAQTACPEGWHLPDDEEWEQLVQYVNKEKGPYRKIPNDHGFSAKGWFNVGAHLKSNRGWLSCESNGSNDYNFNALPGGSFYGVFRNDLRSGFWWSDSKINEDIIRIKNISCSSNIYYSASYANTGCSVRCLKD